MNTAGIEQKQPQEFGSDVTDQEVATIRQREERERKYEAGRIQVAREEFSDFASDPRAMAVVEELAIRGGPWSHVAIPRYGVNANAEMMSKELAQQFDRQLEDELRRRGRLDRLEDFRRRGHILGDTLALAVNHPVHDERPKEYWQQWTDAKPRLHPLTVALEFLLSADGPEAELARRVHVLKEEARADAERTREQEEAQRKRDEINRAERVRADKWSALPVSARAALLAASAQQSGTAERSALLELARCAVRATQDCGAPKFDTELEEMMNTLATKVAVRP